MSWRTSVDVLSEAGLRREMAAVSGLRSSSGSQRITRECFSSRAVRVRGPNYRCGFRSGRREMSRRILIVDDDRALSEVIRDKLVIEGFVVECATDADEAVRQSQSFMPDLVLLDVMLPRSSGFDLVPIVRRERKVPIVFLSARGLQVDKLRGLESGADDYITKPFDMQELLARIRAVVRRTAGVVDRIT